MSTYFRRDEWVTDALGNAISGAQVYVCTQPATTTSIPPSPLATIYADPNGASPLTQPVISDGYGHAFYYVAPGTYTVLYNSPQIQELILPDQSVAPGGVSVPVQINQGGTGATTAPQALTNLGAAKNGANVDITSLGDIPNTLIDTNGYKFGPGTFGVSTTPVIQIANQAWLSSPLYTGYGIGISSVEGETFICDEFINTPLVGTNSVETINLNCTDEANIGLIRVGGASSSIIQSFTTGVPVTIGSLGNPTGPTVIIASGQTSIASGKGDLAFDQFYPTQSTVGAAGSASAPPTNPLIYIEVMAYVAGVLTPVVLAAYKRS